ncbi:transposase [Bacillus proteolyticus]|uniref:transposase n=1 Tax=Bacillus proteolyticus TaxID=2026192 RepID=UPI003CFD5214
MDAESFIKSLYESVIKDNNNLYKESFLNTNIDDVKDPYWQDVLKLYTELPEGNKDALFKVIKQVQIDTIATVLGVLDGVVFIENEDLDIRVTTKGDSELISGDLLDLFLAYDEENR